LIGSKGIRRQIRARQGLIIEVPPVPRSARSPRDRPLPGLAPRPVRTASRRGRRQVEI